MSIISATSRRWKPRLPNQNNRFLKNTKIMTERERKSRNRASLAYYYRNREKCLAQQRAWRESHKEHCAEYRKATAEKQAEYQRRYYQRHKSHRRAYSRMYNATHKDQQRAYNSRPGVKAKKRAYKARPEVKARAKATNHRWYLKNKTHVLEYSKEYYRTHPQFRDYRNTLSAQYNAERDERCRDDAEYYAKVRAYDRIRKAKKCIAEGRVYKGRPSRRIPDDARKGDLLLRDGQQAISRAEMYQSGLRIARRAI